MLYLTAMLSPVQVVLKMPDGDNRSVIIEPVLRQADGQALSGTGVFRIFKDAFEEESALFTEPLEIHGTNDDIPDDANPDFLGKLTIEPAGTWIYEGGPLSAGEQEQVAAIILGSGA